MFTYDVWGIRRSGNHAIIGWLLNHVGTPFIHFNDIQDPWNPLTPGGVRVAGVPAWQYKRGLLRKARQFFRSRREATFAGSDPSVDYERLATLSGLACRVFSYEDKLVTGSSEALGAAMPGETRKSVLLLRDPFNLFASLLKAGYFSRPLDELPGIYARHAEAFLLQHETGIIGVNYNEWFQNADYRVSTAHRLGFDTNGAPYDEVPPNGGGSSFSGRARRGQASKMNVLSRWRHFAEHAQFARLVSESCVREAAEVLYPELAEAVYRTLRPAASGSTPSALR